MNNYLSKYIDFINENIDPFEAEWEEEEDPSLLDTKFIYKIHRDKIKDFKESYYDTFGRNLDMDFTIGDFNKFGYLYALINKGGGVMFFKDKSNLRGFRFKTYESFDPEIDEEWEEDFIIEPGKNYKVKSELLDEFIMILKNQGYIPYYSEREFNIMSRSYSRIGKYVFVRTSSEDHPKIFVFTNDTKDYILFESFEPEEEWVNEPEPYKNPENIRLDELIEGEYYVLQYVDNNHLEDVIYVIKFSHIDGNNIVSSNYYCVNDDEFYKKGELYGKETYNYDLTILLPGKEYEEIIKELENKQLNESFEPEEDWEDFEYYDDPPRPNDVFELNSDDWEYFYDYITKYGYTHNISGVRLRRKIFFGNNETIYVDMVGKDSVMIYKDKLYMKVAVDLRNGRLRKFDRNKNESYKIYESIKEEMTLPNDVIELFNIFDDNGYDLFVAGGAVRDFVLNKSPKDYDLVTNAQPRSIIRLLSDKYRLGLQGRHFAVVRVFTDETPEGIEIASYRKDIAKGRDNKSNDKPKVEYGHHITIRDDVYRRDLTCNALYYDIKNKKIVDLVGGLIDIENGIIRAVGQPEMRIREDRLRLLRIFRFAARMNSKIDKDTSEAIRRDNRLNGISEEDDVSQERIIKEFFDMLYWSKDHNDMSAWLRYLDLLKEYKMFVRMFPNVHINTHFFSTFNPKIIFTRLFDQNDPSDRFKIKLTEFKINNDIRDVVMFLLTIKKYFNERRIGDLLDYENDSLNVLDIYRIKRNNPEIDEETIGEFIKFYELSNNKYIKALMEFRESVSAFELMKMGFKKRKLGNEIRRLEIENYMKIVNNY